MGSKRVSAVSVCVRDPAEIRPILKMRVLKVCSAAPTLVESVMGSCWRSGAKLWHSTAELEHTEKNDFKLWGLWICGVEQYRLVWDFFGFGY